MVTMTSIFGNITPATYLENEVASIIKLWIATYLQEVEIQEGRTRGALQTPKSYSTKATMESLADDQLPCCVILSPGLVDAPYKDGEGNYYAHWQIGVGVIVSARDEVNTQAVAKLYGAAIRALLLQKGSHDDITDVQWLDESYDDLQIDDERTLGVAIVEFSVQVESVVNRYGGPADPIPPDPDEQPGSVWPIFESADVEVRKES